MAGKMARQRMTTTTTGKSLAADDYMLYEALNLLKGLAILQERMQ